MRALPAGLMDECIHHAETIAAYGGPLGAVKKEDNFVNL